MSDSDRNAVEDIRSVCMNRTNWTACRLGDLVDSFSRRVNPGLPPSETLRGWLLKHGLAFDWSAMQLVVDGYSARPDPLPAGLLRGLLCPGQEVPWDVQPALVVYAMRKGTTGWRRRGGTAELVEWLVDLLLVMAAALNDAMSVEALKEEKLRRRGLAAAVGCYTAVVHRPPRSSHLIRWQAAVQARAVTLRPQTDPRSNARPDMDLPFLHDIVENPLE